MTRKDEKAKRMKVGPMSVRIQCPGEGDEHEFDLNLDTREYMGMPFDARHRGIRCTVCSKRVVVPLASLAAVARGDIELVPRLDVELDVEREVVDPPDPKFCEQRKRRPLPPK